MRGTTLEPAYVLHARAYRDTSLQVELLGREHGRVGLIARGARSPRTRQAGLLRPFQPLRVSWQARGELGTLTGVEAVTVGLELSGTRLASAFYLNEILLRLLEREEPQVALFDAYALALGRLAGEAPEAPVLRRFECELLQCLGYGLILDRDSAGVPLGAEQWYRVHPHAAPEPVAPDAGHIRGAHLLALAAGVPDTIAARAVRGLLRDALRPQLGSRPLRSRELYRRRPRRDI